MLYLRCPTCRTLMGDKELYYERELEKICASSLRKGEANKAKEQLVNSTALEKPCCRMRILTCVKLIELIK